MTGKSLYIHLVATLLVVIVVSFDPAACYSIDSHPYFFQDTSRTPGKDTLRYPIEDRRGDRYSSTKRNPFDLRDPANLKDSVIYDPRTNQYYIVEKIGSTWFRKPVAIDFDEFNRILSRREEINYFQKRSDATFKLNRRILNPHLQVKESFFNRLFSLSGTPKIDIKPQGEINITAGYQGQNIKNPTLAERARKNGTFDFDVNANLNVNANIGDKLKLPLRYNTLANFEYDNQLRLDYEGGSDEIIKKIEAGNISFPNYGTLIQGAQSLFGVKTQLQFGKLYVTGVLANQRSNKQSLGLQGGVASTNFEIKADEYEENRHFLLAQYFRDNYNQVMSNLPAVLSQVQILRIEVWVTNRTGATTETRNIVGLMDLGEADPFQQPPVVNPLTNSPLPQNNANDLYQRLISDPNNRNPTLIVNRLNLIGLTAVQDYEKTFARKLSPGEYYYNPQVGFLSLNQALQPDEVLGVAFQYTYNGKVYQVGEFSQDVPPDTLATNSGTSKILFVKLLKATSQRPALPIWKLMMKNVYSVGYGALERKDFQFHILYEEPGGGEKRYLPEGEEKGVPLLSLTNLDRLNNQNDPVYGPSGELAGDGQFDYIEGFTVLSQYSRIIFPELEPFGKDLEFAFRGPDSTELRQKYLFYPLYDSIKWVAQQSPQLNRFVFKGTSKSAGGGSEIYLGAINVPRGSVTVTAGGQVLREDYDYTIDYNSGTVKILNQAIINSGIPVNVQFENNNTFGLQQRNFMALRLDYLAKNTATKQLKIGGTLMRLGERPFFTKMNYGDDPIRNSMLGLDFTYRSDWNRLTKWLDKLPFYSTKAPSSIQAVGEFAKLNPGHPPQIGKGRNGLVYIDDFEGTKSGIDLRFPFISWALASTPYNAKDSLGNILFPEAALNDSLAYGKNRAKLAWYNIEPVLQERKNPNNPLGNNLDELSDPRVRLVNNLELFPQRTPDIGQNNLSTFDLAFYPRDKGPYNFDDENIDADGKLQNPEKRWGGIMRAIDQVDFESNNIEFIEMWIQDPFILKENSKGGELYIDLGNVSEDILKDSRRFYENGLPTPTSPSVPVGVSAWGISPQNPIQIANAFSNDPQDRPYQDVGFDGLADSSERTFHAAYLNDILTKYGAASQAYINANNDPSSDDYVHYRDASFDAANTGILGRYKNYNNPQGNSPVSSTNSQYSSAATLYPDNEDLNRDNTLNEVEEYFQYRIQLRDTADPMMQPGNNFIVEKRSIGVSLANGQSRSEIWYQFRIPIAAFDNKVGNIPDFKSIRFIRMFMTGFEDSTVVRFGKLELVRNQWRNFRFQLDTTGQYKPLDNQDVTSVNISAVNVEENDRRFPVPYVIPPGIERIQQLSNNGINILNNEQAMSVKICGLQDGDSRGVFKTLNHDLRQYKKLQMFLHVESSGKFDDLNDGDLDAVIRMGTDFINNFYQIRIPLKVTRWGATSDTAIWPAENELNINLQDLVDFKLRRTGSPNTFYTEVLPNGTSFSIIGNPNLAETKGFLVAIENPRDLEPAPKCAEIWINELRLSGLDELGGWAATGRVDITLADLGSVSVSGAVKTAGFGSIDQRVNERSRETVTQLDASANLQLGKLLPRKVGIEIPFYASYSQTIADPQYDPYDKDVKLRDKLDGSANKDSIRRNAQDFYSVKTFNFTNVRKTKTGTKNHPWDISNFDLSYSFTQTTRHNSLIENEDIKKYYGGLGYTFNAQPKYIEPFKKLKAKTKWLDFVKALNINPIPALVSFRADINRQFGAIRPREVQIPGVPPSPFKIPETYDKYFTFDRIYNLKWDLARSLNLDFSAVNNARVDEPYGRIDTKFKKETVKENLFDGGRNVMYNQKAGLAYNVPTDKFPFLDWTNLRANYSTTYSWIGASRLALNLGNVLENSQDRVVNGQLNFDQLYRKIKWLRNLDQPVNRPASGGAGKKATADTSAAAKAQKKKEEKAPGQISTVARIFGKLITSIKTVNLNYTENYNTRLPGYNDSTKILGQNWKTRAPGLDFVFGRQPDTAWLNKAADNGWLTRDSLFNLLFTQNYRQELRMDAQVEPFPDLRIDLNLSKAFSKNYSELFKDSTYGNDRFRHLTPYAGGGFDITYLSYKTLFKKFDPNTQSETFKKFEDYRLILSERLAKGNPYTGSNPVQNPDGYYEGYNRYAQDVLIPAFLAAYTDQDPSKIGLIKQSNPKINSNPFRKILPKPNWKITYTGLSRIKGLDKIFTNFSLTHGYTSNLSMNSFISALNFADPFGYGVPGFIDTISGNYIPYFLVPNITITEAFQPLLGVDMSFANLMNYRIEFSKSRTLSLSLIDFQLSEVRSTQFTFSAGWRKKGGLPFTFRGKKLTNDVDIQVDVTYRDDATSNNVLDQASAFATGGQKVWNISPSMNYTVNNRVRIKIFFDQRRVTPYISTSAPSVNTRAGVQLQLSLQ